MLMLISVGDGVGYHLDQAGPGTQDEESAESGHVNGVGQVGGVGNALQGRC